MTPKQYLMQYKKYMTDIIFYKAMKEEAIINVASLKSPAFGNSVIKTPENDPIGNLVFELEKDVAKYDMEILNLNIKMMMIDRQICHMKEVNDDYFKILSYKYKAGMDWQQIADKMHMGLSTVTHLHRFDELFGNQYKNA